MAWNTLAREAIRLGEDRGGPPAVPPAPVRSNMSPPSFGRRGSSPGPAERYTGYLLELLSIFEDEPFSGRLEADGLDEVVEGPLAERRFSADSGSWLPAQRDIKGRSPSLG